MTFLFLNGFCRDLVLAGHTGKAEPWCAAGAQDTLKWVGRLAQGWEQACAQAPCRLSIQQKDPCTS